MPASRAHGVVLLDLRAVVDGHVPAAEIDHAGAGGAVDGVQRGRLERHGNLVPMERSSSSASRTCWSVSAIDTWPLCPWYLRDYGMVFRAPLRWAARLPAAALQSLEKSVFHPDQSFCLRVFGVPLRPQRVIDVIRCDGCLLLIWICEYMRYGKGCQFLIFMPGRHAEAAVLALHRFPHLLQPLDRHRHRRPQFLREQRDPQLFQQPAEFGQRDLQRAALRSSARAASAARGCCHSANCCASRCGSAFSLSMRSAIAFR